MRMNAMTIGKTEEKKKTDEKQTLRILRWICGELLRYFHEHFHASFTSMRFFSLLRAKSKGRECLSERDN